MRITILIVDRSYLRPEPVGLAELTGLVQALLPAAVVPDIRWTGSSLPDHGVLFDDARAPNPSGIPGLQEWPMSRAHRLDLLTEYVRDMATPNMHVALVVPSDDVDDPTHSNINHMLCVAMSNVVGQEALTVTRAALSREAEAVLHALGVAEAASAHTTSTLFLTDAGLDLPAAMLRNFTLAVLTAGERRLAGHTIFGGVNRVLRAASQLMARGQWLLPGTRPELIEHALAPGGELFELLVRPEPAAASIMAALFTSMPDDVGPR